MASSTKNNDSYGFNNINECNVNRENIINNVQQNIISTINQILHGDEHNYYTKSNVNGVNDHSTDLWNDSAATGQQQTQQIQKKQEQTTTINKSNNYPNSNSNPNNHRATPETNQIQSSNNAVNSFSNSRNHFNAFNNGYTPIICPNQEQYQADYWPDKGIVKTSFNPQFMELIDFPGPWHLNECKLDLSNSDRTIQLTRNQYFSNAHHATASGKNL